MTTIISLFLEKGVTFVLDALSFVLLPLHSLPALTKTYETNYRSNKQVHILKLVHSLPALNENKLQV